MDKKKLALIIACTALAMALTAALLILWLVPGNQVDEPQQNNSGTVTEQQTGEPTNGEETVDTTAGITDEPTVGVDVEIPGNTENGGSSGNTGNGGSSGNTGNQGGNNEIDFDDLLGSL